MSAETARTPCPDEKALMAFVADPLKAENVDIAEHLLVCDACRDAAEAMLETETRKRLTPAERASIARVVNGRCHSSVLERLDLFVSSRQVRFFDDGQPAWRMSAASGVAGVASEVPEDVRFVFVSAENAVPADRWMAELSLPASACGSAALDIRIRNAASKPVGNGRFCLAGMTLAVANGTAQIPYDRFLVGIRDSKVSYQREGGASVPGNLVFF